jgi:phosphoenolpyruvate synthase/pyruvate phosphate dikinase
MSGKTENLTRIKDMGIKVPCGFVVNDTIFTRHIAPIRSALSESSVTAESARNRICGLELDTQLQSFLNLAIDNIRNPPLFAIRSAAKVYVDGHLKTEDGDKLSLAGQFDSFLNVPRILIPEAIKMCWASLFNERSLAQYKKSHSYLDSSVMEVVVQEMIPASASAVVMTVDPLGDGSIGAIECTWGPCEALVSGVVNPDEIFFRRSDGMVLSYNVASKTHYVAYDIFDGVESNAHNKLTPENKILSRSLSENQVREIIDVSRRIEHLLGAPQDIEIVFNQDGDLYVTQSRHITILKIASILEVL